MRYLLYTIYQFKYSTESTFLQVRGENLRISIEKMRDLRYNILILKKGLSYMKNYFGAADILLPDFEKIEGERWACVACDQYTSEPEYWEGAAKVVGDSPSTLKVILPEVYLSETEERVPKINAEMEKYLKEVLLSHPDSMIFLERTQRDGVVRRGIIGIVDLEEYDYNKGSTSLIRATEGTVLSRIPPRVKIRRDAAIELPHVMLLIDDPAKTVIEPSIRVGSILNTSPV